MFEWMNRHKKDIMKYTLYLVIPSFIVLYGYGKCAEPPAFRWVVKVNGERVPDYLYQKIVENVGQQMKNRFGPDADIPRAEIDRQALETAIHLKLYEQKAKEWGITTTDEEVERTIRQMPIPAFRDQSNNFNPAQYRYALLANGLNPAEFEQDQRNNLTRTKVMSVVQHTSFRAATDAKRMDDRTQQKVRVEYLAFEPSSYVDEVTPTSEQISKYFADRQEDYRIPEQRRIAYAQFSPAAFTQVVSVTDSQLKSYFDKNQTNFEVPERATIQQIVYRSNDFVQEATAAEEEIQNQYTKNAARYVQPEQIKARYVVQPLAALAEKQDVTDAVVSAYYQANLVRFQHGEQAKARHILLRATPGLSETEVTAIQNRILDIRQEIEKGLPFAEAAKKYSDDPGSAPKGGDLGYFDRRKMVPAFDEAAFSLPLMQMSEPIKSNYGFHLILVEDRKPAGTDTLEQAKSQVQDLLKKEAAVNSFKNYAATLKSLDGLKDKYEIKTTDFFSRGENIPGIPNLERFLFSSSAFLSSPNQLVQFAGNANSENLYLIEMLEHRPSRPLSLDEARPRVLQTIKMEKADSLAKLAAEADAARIKSASLTLEPIAAERKLTVQTVGPFKRDENYVPELGPNASAVISVAFTLKDGEINGPINTSLGHHIIRLLGREAAHLPQFEEVRREVERALIQDQSERMARNEANSFSDQIFDKQQTLEKGAAAAKVKWGTTELFKQNDTITGLGPLRNVNAEAFQLKKVGDVSNAIEERERENPTREPSATSPIQNILIIELLEIKPTYLPPLEEVKDQVEHDVKLQMGETIAEQQAMQTLKAVQTVLAASGPIGATRAIDLSLYEDKAAGKERLGGKGARYYGPLEVNALGSVPNIGMAYSFAKTAMALAPGKVSGLINNYRMKTTKEKERVKGPMTGIYILQVLDRIPADPKQEDPTSKQFAQYLDQSIQSIAFSAWLDEVSAATKIQYNPAYFKTEVEEAAGENIKGTTSS